MTRDSAPAASGRALSAADAGFTLIEALVAMAVLAVAATGLIRATSGHLDLIARLEARAAGGWAAGNALAETRLGLSPAATPLLGRTWLSTVATHASDDPAIAALTATAAAAGTKVTLRGFVDTVRPSVATSVALPSASTASSTPVPNLSALPDSTGIAPATRAAIVPPDAPR